MTGIQPNRDQDQQDRDSEKNENVQQTTVANGIVEIESITQTWSRRNLYGSWVAIFVLSIAMHFMMQTKGVYSNYATSSFGQFSLISTLKVVEGVVKVVIRPILAKISDAVGRFEGYMISTISLLIGTTMLAVSPSIGVYFAGEIFNDLGTVGFQFMNGVFAIDTTDLVHRTFFTILPNICLIFIPWTTGPITTAMLDVSSWRWGLGTWAIIVPLSAVPLLIVLFVGRIKARRTYTHRRLTTKSLLEQLDIGGSVLLAAALALIFLAIPLASSHAEKWRQPHIIVMLILGVMCLIAFPIYEAKIPKYPILRFETLRNYQVGKTFIYIFLYFTAYNIYTPYFFAWLMIVFDFSNTAATNVNVVATVSQSFSGIVASALIKYTRNIKWVIFAGNAIHFVGMGLIYSFRRIGTSTVKLVVAQAIDGFGAGFLSLPNRVMMQSFSTHTDVTQLTGLYLSFLAVGQVVGDAISGAVYRSYFVKSLANELPDKSHEWVMEIFNDYTKGLEYPMDSRERIAIIQVYNEVMRLLLIPPFVCFGIMILIVLSYPNVKLDQIDDGIPGRIFGREKDGNDGDTEESRNGK